MPGNSSIAAKPNLKNLEIVLNVKRKKDSDKMLVQKHFNNFMEEKAPSNSTSSTS